MEQPSWDANAATWRRFAGHLRQHVGGALVRATAAQMRVTEADAMAVRARESARRSRRLLNHIENLIADGNVDAVSQVLAERRARIEAARSARDEVSL